MGKTITIDLTRSDFTHRLFDFESLTVRDRNNNGVYDNDDTFIKLVPTAQPYRSHERQEPITDNNQIESSIKQRLGGSGLFGIRIEDTVSLLDNIEFQEKLVSEPLINFDRWGVNTNHALSRFERLLNFKIQNPSFEISPEAESMGLIAMFGAFLLGEDFRNAVQLYAEIKGYDSNEKVFADMATQGNLIEDDLLVEFTKVRLDGCVYYPANTSYITLLQNILTPENFVKVIQQTVFRAFENRDSRYGSHLSHDVYAMRYIKKHNVPITPAMQIKIDSIRSELNEIDGTSSTNEDIIAALELYDANPAYLQKCYAARLEVQVREIQSGIRSLKMEVYLSVFREYGGHHERMIENPNYRGASREHLARVSAFYETQIADISDASAKQSLTTELLAVVDLAIEDTTNEAARAVNGRLDSLDFLIGLKGQYEALKLRLSENAG